MNVALQTATPSHAYRLVALLSSPDSRVLPTEGFGKQVWQFSRSLWRRGRVLWEAEQIDDCLVRLVDVTVELKAFIERHRDSILYRHIRRIYWLNPHYEATQLSELLSAVESAAESFDSLKIICYPRRLEQEIATGLSLDVALDPRSSSHVLSVVQHGQKYLYGLTPREHNYFQLCTEPRVFESYSSAAVNKLDEAIRYLMLDRAWMQTVIDLGAAPGGWTRYLSQHAKSVFAIDGADLSEEVIALPNVVHIKGTADVALHELKAQLAERVSGVTAWADLLVSDMNVTPYNLIDILDDYKPCLREKGRLIATLKFIGTRNNRDQQLSQLKSMLENRSWKCVKFIWLMANTKSERMMTAVR